LKIKSPKNDTMEMKKKAISTKHLRKCAYY
jgi:hypothetical protein